MRAQLSGEASAERLSAVSSATKLREAGFTANELRHASASASYAGRTEINGASSPGLVHQGVGVRTSAMSGMFGDAGCTTAM